MRAINRKLLLLAMIVFTIAICYKVSSYTYAKVQSNLNFSINSSDNALIAMPEDIVLNANKVITVTTVLLDKADYNKYEDNYKGNETSIVELSSNKKDKIYMVKEMSESIELTGNNLYIKNNMNQTITVSSNNTGIIYFDNISIAPGGIWYVPCSVGLGQENQDIDLTITAKWQDGSANIYKKISLNVYTDYKNIEVDLRKPKEEKATLPKDGDLNNPIDDDKKDDSKDKIDNKENKDNKDNIKDNKDKENKDNEKNRDNKENKDGEENKNNNDNKDNKDNKDNDVNIDDKDNEAVEAIVDNKANEDFDDNNANKGSDYSDDNTNNEVNDQYNTEHKDNKIDDESQMGNDGFDSNEDVVNQEPSISEDSN